jgi:hypothetical protein
MSDDQQQPKDLSLRFGVIYRQIDSEADRIRKLARPLDHVKETP